MTLRNALISLLLITSIGLSAWSILTSNTPRSARPPEDLHLPDGYMEDVIAIIMNKQGTPSIKLATPLMIHYAANDTTDMQKPTVTVYRKSPNPWDIHADYAEATKGIEQINFLRHVVIHHLGDKESPPTTMLTSALTVYPGNQSAQTDQDVTISQPDTTIQATGMQANMNEGTVKLLSQAKGEYVPTSS